MLTTCEFCGKPVDTDSRLTLRHVEGWEQHRLAGGTNAIALRQPHDRFACSTCIDLQRRGIPIGQATLV